MANPLSQEMREAIIYHKKNGIKNEEIVKWLRISEASVKRIWKLSREENTLTPKPLNRGRKPAFCEKKMEKIKEKIKEQPDMTLEELVEFFKLNISISALSRKLTKQDLSFKKRRCFVKNSYARMCNGCAVNG